MHFAWAAGNDRCGVARGGAQEGDAMTDQLELLTRLETYVGAAFVAFYGFERFRKPPSEPVTYSRNARSRPRVNSQTSRS